MGFFGKKKEEKKEGKGISVAPQLLMTTHINGGLSIMSPAAGGTKVLEWHVNELKKLVAFNSLTEVEGVGIVYEPIGIFYKATKIRKKDGTEVNI